MRAFWYYVALVTCVLLARFGSFDALRFIQDRFSIQPLSMWFLPACGLLVLIPAAVVVGRSWGTGATPEQIARRNWKNCICHGMLVGLLLGFLEYMHYATGG